MSSHAELLRLSLKTVKIVKAACKRRGVPMATAAPQTEKDGLS